VLRTAPTLPAQPERQPYADVPALEVGERWYAGDFHVHSRESGDASPTLDEIADFARSRGLDFVVLTDHNTVTQLDFILEAQARHPDLLFVPGTEFTTYAGHATAIGATGWVDHKLGLPGVSIEAAAEAYAAQGALLSINHPVLDLGELCIGCAWDEAVPAGIAGVEIQNGGWEPTGVLFTLDAITFWDQLLDQSQRPAALGGSDDHRAGTDTGPFASPIGDPTTLVWATELSVPALLDGVRAQRTVVKLQDGSDPMVEVAADGLGVTAKVTGAVGAELVWVVDGQSEVGIPVDADPFEATLEAGEGSRVRAEVWGDGHPRTVTSHVWPAAGDTGEELPDGPGCGCGSSPRGGTLLLVGLLAVIRLRSGRGEGSRASAG
jgi:hypothetical protein